MPVHHFQKSSRFPNPVFFLNGWLEGSKDQQCIRHIAYLRWFSDWSDWFLVGDCRVASSHCFSWGWRRTASQTPSTDRQGITWTSPLPSSCNLVNSSHLNNLNHQMQFLLPVSPVSPVSPGWSTKQCRACSKAQPLQSHHFLQLSQLLCHALPPATDQYLNRQTAMSPLGWKLVSDAFLLSDLQKYNKRCKSLFSLHHFLFLSQPTNEA